MAMESATAFSFALPVTSWKTATEACDTYQSERRREYGDQTTHIDAAALFEECAYGLARSLWRAKDHIDIFRRDNVGVVLVDNREPVREVEGLALLDVWFDCGPGLGLRSIGEEIHDDGSLLERLLDGEEVFASDPAVLLGELPAVSAFAHADDNVEPVIARIEPLSVACWWRSAQLSRACMVGPPDKPHPAVKKVGGLSLKCSSSP